MNREHTEKDMKPEVLQTKNGKGVSYRTDMYGMYEIYFTSGGELPKELQGKWTSSTKAFKVIEEYVEKTKQAKETKTNNKQKEELNK